MYVLACTQRGGYNRKKRDRTTLTESALFFNHSIWTPEEKRENRQRKEDKVSDAQLINEEFCS